MNQTSSTIESKTDNQMQINTESIKMTSAEKLDSQKKQLAALRAANARLEEQRKNQYSQINQLTFCLTILHGQGIQKKKELKKEHAELMDKKTALKTAICAARGTNTKFDEVASFWEEFVLEPEEREQHQQQQRQNQAKTTKNNMTNNCWKNSEDGVSS